MEGYLAIKQFKNGGQSYYRDFAQFRIFMDFRRFDFWPYSVKAENDKCQVNKILTQSKSGFLFALCFKLNELQCL